MFLPFAFFQAGGFFLQGFNPLSQSVGLTGVLDVLEYTDAGKKYLIFGGNFGNYGSTSRPYLAKLDGDTGSLVPAFAPTFNNKVFSLHIDPLDPTFIYCAGDFTVVNGIARNGACKLNITTGALDSWNPTPVCTAKRVILSDANGVFIGGTGNNAVSKHNKTTGALVPGFTSTSLTKEVGTGQCNNLLLANSSLYVLGEFQYINGFGPFNPSFGIAVGSGKINPTTGAVDTNYDVYQGGGLNSSLGNISGAHFDGTYLYLINFSRLWKVNANTGVRDLAYPNNSFTSVGDVSNIFEKDGFLYVAVSRSSFHSYCVKINMATGNFDGTFSVSAPSAGNNRRIFPMSDGLIVCGNITDYQGRAYGDGAIRVDYTTGNIQY